jgi:hypothetical protein
MAKVKANAKKAMAKIQKPSDKLSKSLKAQIIALIENANKGTHKSIAKLEKQVLGLNFKKKDKPKAINKKKASAKKTAEQVA